MKSTDYRNFKLLVKESFKFLESEYSFKMIYQHRSDWGYEIMYLNETTGVKIMYEFREAYIVIILYRLIYGKIVENPVTVKLDSILYGYGLDDIIALRNSAALIKPGYEYGKKNESQPNRDFKDFKSYVEAFATNLKSYASDVLSGKFEIFRETEVIVKNRVKKYQL